jgi:hypothetical protein
MYTIKDYIVFESLVEEKDWNIFIGKKTKARIEDEDEKQYKIVFNDKHFVWLNKERVDSGEITLNFPINWKAKVYLYQKESWVWKAIVIGVVLITLLNYFSGFLNNILHFFKNLW